jgi:predicted AAA+ superfamily ATPase
MAHAPRVYDTIFKQHIDSNRQMLWVVGARQVGKTECCRLLGSNYLNWDNLDDRGIILQGPQSVASHIGLHILTDATRVVVFDEIHKWSKWQIFLKGFFDTYGDNVRIIVTGSSRLDIHRKGGDSLMGRYFLYRMYPFTVGEIAHPHYRESSAIINEPECITDDDFNALYEHGGFPEPYLKRTMQFTRRWSTLRANQLLRDDIRETTKIQEVAQVEILAQLLADRSGAQLNFSSLANDMKVSSDTISRWIDTLVNLHLGFIIRPWFTNIANSLKKEPKWYHNDWALLKDQGSKIETVIACHLRKSVDLWNDLGAGEFGLWYLRDKQQHEVDFIVTRDNRPWFLIEVKKSETKLSPMLAYFQEKTKAEYAFQVVYDLPFVNVNCFGDNHTPVVVPARTFLSQLM